jgi:hypothetical protein
MATASCSFYSLIPHLLSSSPSFIISLYIIRTTAVTYVKEWVHGDLGRTVPSVESILRCGSGSDIGDGLGGNVDILQLDVVHLYDQYGDTLDEAKQRYGRHSHNNNNNNNNSNTDDGDDSSNKRRRVENQAEEARMEWETLRKLRIAGLSSQRGPTVEKEGK